MWDKKSSDDYTYTAPLPRCYESHPVLKLSPGWGAVYGGSAAFPAVKHADIYVALQVGSTCSKISDPWEEQGVVEIQYSIPDQGIPANLPRFKKMITWLCTQLQLGKSIHIGCVGGHGRTGLVLAALVAQSLQKKDAIQWVRKHYCKKAVESAVQVKFLRDHYGVSDAPVTKDFSAGSKLLPGWTATPEGMKTASFTAPRPESLAPVKVLVPEGASVTKKFEPLGSSRCLWRKRK